MILIMKLYCSDLTCSLIAYKNLLNISVSMFTAKPVCIYKTNLWKINKKKLPFKNYNSSIEVLELIFIKRKGMDEFIRFVCMYVFLSRQEQLCNDIVIKEDERGKYMDYSFELSKIMLLFKSYNEYQYKAWQYNK